MAPIRYFHKWLNPIPPEHQRLEPAFDVATRAELWNVAKSANLLGGVGYMAFIVTDYLLYSAIFGRFLVVRIGLSLVFCLAAVSGRWLRGRVSPYAVTFANMTAASVVVGLMFVVNRDPTGPYWLFYFLMVTYMGFLPWPVHWAIRTNLMLLASYAIMGSLTGGLARPVAFLTNVYCLVVGIVTVTMTHRLLARLRWNSFYNLLRVRQEKAQSEKLVNVVIPIGVALPAEKDLSKLLEVIVLEAQSLCNADAGTLYLRTDDDCLTFSIMRSRSLNIAYGGTTGTAVPFPPIRLHDPATGAPNQRHIAAHAVLSGATVRVADAYQSAEFDFSGVRAYDAQTGYRSTSCLTVPLKNTAGQAIGALQLLNAQDAATGNVIPFDEYLQSLVESLSALGVVALEGYIREQGLKDQIEQLRIRIDETKRAKQVAEITGTDYFQALQQKARAIRSKPYSTSR